MTRPVTSSPEMVNAEFGWLAVLLTPSILTVQGTGLGLGLGLQAKASPAGAKSTAQATAGIANLVRFERNILKFLLLEAVNNINRI